MQFNPALAICKFFSTTALIRTEMEIHADAKQKGRQKVIDAWVEVGGIRRDEMPKYYTDIEMHFVVKGVDINEKRVIRAIDLAMEKYCSASAQMAALANIKTSYEIIEADTPL